MKLWNRVCSLLLAMALLFGLLPTVRPTVAEAKAPAEVHNNLPSTAKDIVYLSDMAWESSVNYSGANNGQTIRDTRWADGAPIKLGINLSSDTSFSNTTFTKGLGVMPKGTDSTPANASYTVFDLADNNYEQSFFYAAAGLTNPSALPNGDDARNSANGVVFEVWGSYDRSCTSYSAAEYELLESSGSADNDNYVTKGYVHQFHVDVTGVRYLKLVVYAVNSINGMNAAWGGACVYNNPGYYPKSDLMGLNNNTDNSTWVPSGTSRFHTYNFNSIPSDAVLLSGSTYKDSATYTGTDKVVDLKIYNNGTALGNGGFWLGGEADTITCTSAVTKDGIVLKDATKYLRFNCRAPGASNKQSDGWVTFDISDLDVNRFYAAIGLTGGTIKHTAYAPDTGKYGGIKVQVWGAETVDGTYTLLSESEPIILSNVGEFDVDITGVKFLKLRIQAKDTQDISQLDTMFYMPCVYKTVDVTVDGTHSALRGLSYNYTASVTGGDGTETVTWAVSGNSSASTVIDATGKLTVGSDETAACLDITATAGETVSESFPVVVRRTPQNMYNQLPKTAKDIKYLSDMTWEYNCNRDSMVTKKDLAPNGTAIVLGDIAANDGTTFAKGLGVKPYAGGESAETLAHTVVDLADNNYEQSFFYAAAGIANDATKSSTSTTSVGNGVYFAVYGSYDKDVNDYSQAEYVLLEKSDKITNGMVHQFQLDVTGVRYLKLVVYTAQSGAGYMDCAWGGACLYNNPGYYPKTDMIGDCNQNSGAYVPYADRDPSLTPTMFNAVENMFNTYQFPNLPANATRLRSKSYTSVYTPGIGNAAFWIGGAHVAVNGQGWQSNFDGVIIPASSTPYFKNQPVSNGVAEGYVVYDVSSLNVDTFYAIIGVTDNAFKYTGYDRATGTYGGVGFEVWGTYEGSSEFKLLSASEIITKSNSGEFIVDITGVKLLKIRHYQQDPRAAQSHGAFAYASVFNALEVNVSGVASVEPGTSASYTAVVRNGFDNYTGDVTWTVSGGEKAGTTMKNGVLTVDSRETATSLTVTASVTVDGKTASRSMTVAVAQAATGVRNHRPKTAEDIKYLSDMTVVSSANYTSGAATIIDGAWSNGAAIKLGHSDADGGTTFTKGLGVMAKGASSTDASYTVFDLAENNYAHDFFYSAVGITNTTAATQVPNNGVVFAVYGSYDKSVTDFNNAQFVLLESSGKVQPNQVYQFHLDVTGVRYLKLVVYSAQSALSYLNSAWGGACLYNNEGYYTKTDMIGDCDQNSGAYIPYADRIPAKTPNMFNHVENNFNTYQFEKLPADVTLLRSKSYSSVCTPGIGKDAIWLGGGHVGVNGQGWQSPYDGIKLPAGSTPYFKDNPDANEGYIVYDVSGMNADTFYALIGAADTSFKYSNYDPSTGNYGGIVFEVLGDYGDGEFKLLSASEVITKSNTGEFMVDITGVKLLKIRHYQQDPNAAQVHGAFGYACVFSQLGVTVSGSTSVVKGATENYAAAVYNGLANGSADVTWTVSGAEKAGTAIDENGVLSVAADETAAELTVTASVTVGEKTVTDSVTVTVVEATTGVLNHLPETATDVKHLSNMTWEYSINNGGKEAVKDRHWAANKAIVLGDLAENGGTTFTKGIGVQPDDTADSSQESAMQTIFDLADNGYAQSYFYAAAGITNDAAKSSTSEVNVTNGVYFAVYGSYDKDEENYADAEYVLLETSDKITKGKVHQFHLNVTGVRYLKLVVYTAQKSLGYMDCNWAGACLYNNPGYYPKTDMIGSCNGDEGAYVAPANPNMFNTYHFGNLPQGATMLATQTQTEAEVYDKVGTTAGWIGGTHLAVNGLAADSIKDGIKFLASTAVHFNVRKPDASDNATDGYVVYDVSSLGADTFYCIVGGTNTTYKYSEYNATNGSFGGLVFEVWGKSENDSDYRLLSASEPILKSNTGEFLVDITGVQSLKLRIRAQDNRTHGYASGGFVYASVFDDESWGVAVSGGETVVKGGTAKLAANVTRGFVGSHYTYTGDIAWTVAGGVAGTKINDGILTVDADEKAASLDMTASITEGGKTMTSNTVTMAVAEKLAYVGESGYDTLADAVVAAKGETITLKGDTEISKGLKLNSPVTLELDGNTVSGAENILLDADADLTVVSDGGTLDGKLKLVDDGATVTSDCAVTLEMNGFDATVNADNVILTDSATDNGDVGGKVYGDITVENRVSKNGVVQYVILDGTDENGDYKTANAVRVKLKKVSVRPSATGIYYTTQLKFNKNVADAEGAAYGVALSLTNKPGDDFATEKNESGGLVNLWTKLAPDKGINFSDDGTSCLVTGILDSTLTDAQNAQRGEMYIYANSYVTLKVNGADVFIMAENDATVKHSLKTVMTGMDKVAASELQDLGENSITLEQVSDNTKKLYNFYEAWEGAMRGWKLSNLTAAYNRDYLKSHQVLLTDIQNGRIIVTDLDANNLFKEENLTWQWKPSTELGWTLTQEDLQNTLSEAKYRTHTKFGDVVLFCSSTGGAGIIAYPSGECLWETKISNSPHSIELLPDGDIVVASSGGGTTGDGWLYYYDMAADGTYSLKNEYALNGAHGVSWDPANNTLWAMSFPKLVAYSVANNALTLKTGVGCAMPDASGHDLMPDYSDNDILWLTDNAGVYRYSKSQNAIIETRSTLGGVKGVAAFSDGLVSFASYSDKGDAAHPATVRVYRPKRNGTYVLEKYTDAASGWNKVRPFVAEYQ